MLNRLNLNIFFFITSFIIFTICLPSCGKRQPPIPPIEATSQEVKIAGFQRGNDVVITWGMPFDNGADKIAFKIKSVNVYRLVESSNAPLTLSEDEFASRSVLISTILVTINDFARQQMTFTDSLQFANQKIRLRYSIRFVNSTGQKKAFSSSLLIEPTENVAHTPTNLSAKTLEKNILLSWIAPKENIDGSQPANVIGYNIYRIENGNVRLLNTVPFIGDNFPDTFFEFGKRYAYFVRTISLGRKGESIESSDSNIIEVKPGDVFAPTSPTAISIAAAPGSLSIFFAANTEKDILGYKIYRSTNLDQSKSQWKPVTTEPLKQNNFQDFDIISGQTYYYYLIAIDTSGNISQPSEVISATAP